MKRFISVLLLCFGAFLSGCETPPSERSDPYKMSLESLWETSTEQERLQIANDFLKTMTIHGDAKILSVDKLYGDHAYMEITIQANPRPQFKYKDIVRHIQNPDTFYPNFRYTVFAKYPREQDIVGTAWVPSLFRVKAGLISVVVVEAYDEYELVRIGDGPEDSKNIRVAGYLLKKVGKK